MVGTIMVPAAAKAVVLRKSLLLVIDDFIFVLLFKSPLVSQKKSATKTPRHQETQSVDYLLNNLGESFVSLCLGGRKRLFGAGSYFLLIQ
jgi:hypothetical protein